MWVRLLFLVSVAIGLNWVVSQQAKKHHRHALFDAIESQQIHQFKQEPIQE